VGKEDAPDRNEQIPDIEFSLFFHVSLFWAYLRRISLRAA
jgi:hypothetical protein